MQLTGERYTVARSHVLRSNQQEWAHWDRPGVLADYPSMGGVQSDSTLLTRAFAHAEIKHPATGKPYSEAMLNGLCGGVGLLYAVFEYKGHAPMLTVVCRSRSMPETFMTDVFDRVGAARQVVKTSSERVADEALDRALAASKPAICVVDLALLPHSHTGPEMAGMSPHYVAVVGSHEDHLWIDDRASKPLAIPRGEIAAARGRYRKARQELFTIDQGAQAVDWRACLIDAVHDTARTLQEGDPSVPASFRSNCGLAGLRKWQKLLTATKNKKGWPALFPSGPLAMTGLRRAYECIHTESTAPEAGRPFYADFLDEAHHLTSAESLQTAAELFRASGAQWKALGESIAGAPDAALRQACQLSDRRAEAMDAADLQALRDLESPAPEACQLSSDAAAAIYASMAETLGEIVELESQAAAALAATA